MLDIIVAEISAENFPWQCETRISRTKCVFEAFYETCRNQFGNNYESSNNRALSVVISISWFPYIFFSFLFLFCVRECDWHAENNMQERSRLTLSRPRKSGSFIKITCPVSREGESINVANVGVASNKFIARKMYNHRIFITVCLIVQFSKEKRCRKCWNSRENVCFEEKKLFATQ